MDSRYRGAPLVGGGKFTGPFVSQTPTNHKSIPILAQLPMSRFGARYERPRLSSRYIFLLSYGHNIALRARYNDFIGFSILAGLCCATEGQVISLACDLRTEPSASGTWLTTKQRISHGSLVSCTVDSDLFLRKILHFELTKKLWMTAPSYCHTDCGIVSAG